MSKHYIKTNCIAEDTGCNLNFLLRIPEAMVLAIGAPSCIRQLYFSAVKQNKQDSFYMCVADKEKLVMGTHLEDIKKAIDIILLKRPKILILYLSCIDTLIGSDMDNLIMQIQINTKSKIILFKRGPLEKRRCKPKEKIKKILHEIINDTSNSKKQIEEIKAIMEDLGDE
ncbi:MAG: hypothetical protein ACK5MV_03055 [Aminipila sp.]